MLRFEVWLHPKHWRLVPLYSDHSRIYTVHWLMFAVEWAWLGE